MFSGMIIVKVWFVNMSDTKLPNPNCEDVVEEELRKLHLPHETEAIPPDSLPK